MRGRGLVAIMAAMMMSHVALAEGDPQAPAGLIGAPEAGGMFAGGADQPGMRLSDKFRLRFDGFSDNLSAITHGISPMRSQSIDATRRRRFSSVVDFFPISDSGFHITAGMRRSPKRARWNPTALASMEIFTPKLASPLRVRTNVARSSPVAMLGWSGDAGGNVRFSLAAGALQEHGRALKTTSLMIARQQPIGYRWSGIGAVASAGVSWSFR